LNSFMKEFNGKSIEFKSAVQVELAVVDQQL